MIPELDEDRSDENRKGETIAVILKVLFYFLYKSFNIINTMIII